jgi:hypothetical protein
MPSRRLIAVLALLLPACATRPPGDAIAPAHTIEVCVVEGGEIRRVEAEVDPATGDTLFGGSAFAARFPLTEAYGEAAGWVLRFAPFDFRRVCYSAYGPPRSLDDRRLTAVGEVRGIPVFAEIEESGMMHPSVLYLPLRPTCVFRSYQAELLMAPCRTSAP